MKGKVIFTFKDKGDGVTGIKHKIALRDVDSAALTKAFANFVERVTPTKKTQRSLQPRFTVWLPENSCRSKF